MNEAIHITCMGTKARELLARLDFSGQVMAVVSEAMYLSVSPHPWLWHNPPQSPPPFDKTRRTGEGEVGWLAQNDVRHQRAILCAFDSSDWRVGMRFDGSVFDLTDASVWQPSTITPERVATHEMVAGRVRELIDSIESLGLPSGFAQLIPLICSNASIARITDPLVNAAINPIVEMARAWRDGDMARAIETGRAIVGLGQGLTPSGDDFIGGMLFAAHWLKTAYPGILNWKQKAIDDLLAWASDKTNRISYTILCDHAAGQSVDALHDLMATLFIEKPSDAIMPSARRLVGIGSTSGWDMLTGAMTSLSSILGNSD